MIQSKHILIAVIVAFGLSPLWGDFVRDDTKEIVVDTKQSLMWQDDVNATQLSWDTAVSHCTDLSFAGYNDWFLPNIEQLQSLINTGNSPTIQSAFKNTASSKYWSSSTYGDTVYYVNFYDGGASNYYKANSLYVRCVRAGQYFDSLDLNNTLLLKNFIAEVELKKTSEYPLYEVNINTQFLMSGYDADNEILSVIVGDDIIGLTELKYESVPLSLNDAKAVYKKGTLATFNTTFGYKDENNQAVLYIKSITIADTNTTQIILDETTKSYCQANPSACGIELNVTMNGFTQDDINNATQFDTTLLQNAQSGWSLLGTKSEITDMSIFDSVKIVWVYKENKWNVYTGNTTFQELIAKNPYLGELTKIGANEGFWIFK